MWRLQVKSIIRLFFVVFIITLLTSYLLVANFFNQLAGYRVILELLQNNREHFQRIPLLANKLNRNLSNISTDLSEELDLIDVNLQLLRYGNNANVDKEQLNVPEPSEEVITEIKNLLNKWQKFRQNIEVFKETILQNDSLSADDQTSQQLKKILFLEKEKSLKSIEDQIEQLAEQDLQIREKYIEIRDTQQFRANISFLILSVMNIIAVVFGIFLTNTYIFRPVDLIARVAKQIEQGDLNTKVSRIRDDEIGSIAHTLNLLVDKISNATQFIKNIEAGQEETKYITIGGEDLSKDILGVALVNMQRQILAVDEEEQRRSWATQGLNIFAELLQKYNDNLNNLAFQAISTLVKYLNAKQGAIFITNAEDEENISLEMLSSYADNRRKFKYRKVLPKEGLIGQAYVDGDTIYLTEIPDEYIEITSGLGTTLPKSILIVPLKYNDRVFGVLELASLKLFEPYEIQFAERVGENLAVTINTTQANDRTKRLLEESRSITSQMSLQEQEMKKNLVKLQQAQEEMQLKQEILSAQSYTIRSTLIYAELDINGFIIMANDLFLEVMLYEEGDVLGRNYSIFIPREPKILREYEQLLDVIKSGEPVTDSFKRVAKDGTVRWLRGTFSPIKDRFDTTYKVMFIAFDVTPEKTARLDFQEQLDSIRRFNATVEIDMQGKFLDVNDLFLEIIEYERSELIGQSHSMIIPKKDLESDGYANMWMRLRKGEYYLGEVKRVTKSGKEVWFQVSFNPILDLNNKPFKILELIVDITERKNAEEEVVLAQEEARLKEAELISLINNTDDIIYTIDRGYRITMFNESARANYERWDFKLRLGLNIGTTFPEEEAQELKALFERAFKGEKFNKSILLNRRQGSNSTYLSMSFNPIKNRKGDITGVSVFAKNISSKIQSRLVR